MKTSNLILAIDNTKCPHCGESNIDNTHKFYGQTTVTVKHIDIMYHMVWTCNCDQMYKTVHTL